MNKIAADILKHLAISEIMNQRDLCKRLKISLGKTNTELKNLQKEKLIDQAYQLTEKGYAIISRNKPNNAIILAAGLGLRMIPLDRNIPKALLNVKGEVLIERVIRQLREVGIEDITIVTGFMNEKFEYLIDKYRVRLIVNLEYLRKNNSVSLYCALNHLGNTYIIPGDIWFDQNPFSNCELYSWYMITHQKNEYSVVSLKRDMTLRSAKEGVHGNEMVGLCYLENHVSVELKNHLSANINKLSVFSDFWEKQLFALANTAIYGNLIETKNFFEINTFEDYRNFETKAADMNSEVLSLISVILSAPIEKIQNIQVLKKGMTNRSFIFTCKEKSYIMRVPGEGTQKLIDRNHEYEIYKKLRAYDITDRVLYISPESGYKLTEYWENARNCDPESKTDVTRCMQVLRQFHGRTIKVSHNFDLFEQIEKYESFLEGAPSVFHDYTITKEKIFGLRGYIDSLNKEYCLTHIDAVPDNFLFVGEEIRIIDWEYAGMQDPHVDIAMFAIYALYTEEQIEWLIDSYFVEGCSEETRVKIWCYIAISGLLWSNWCEYKRKNGVEFGDYALRQYRYAKDYYRKAEERINTLL